MADTGKVDSPPIRAAAPDPSPNFDHNDYNLAGVAHSPLLWLMVGILLLAFWFIGQTIQIQTSEAFILNASYEASLVPHFTIFGQLSDLLQGHESVGMIEAIGYAFSVQIVFFVAALGTERALHSVHSEYNGGLKLSSALYKNATWRARGAIFLLITLTLLDSWADFRFASNISWFSSLIFAVAEFAVSFYVGTRGIHLIEAAIIDFRRPRAKR